MRFLLLVSALILVATASAQEIYKTVDEDGNTVYSDTAPSENAVPADLPDIILEPSLTPMVKLSPPEEEETETPTPLQVTLTSPGNEEVILPSALSIPVFGNVSRPLAEDEFAQ